MRTTSSLIGIAAATAGIGGGMTLVGIPWLGGTLACAGAVIGLAALARTQQSLGSGEDQHLMTRVFTSLEEGLVVQDRQGRIISHNGAAERILGLTSDQIHGRTSMDPRWRSVRADGSPFPGSDHPAMVTLRTGEPQHNVIMGVHRVDGSLVWISINSQPIQFQDAADAAVVCSFTDITESRARTDALVASERALRELGSFQRAMLDSANIIIITTDVGGRIIHFNRTAERILGRASAEVVDRRNAVSLHLPEEVAARAAALSQELGEPVPADFSVFTAKVRHGGADEQEWHLLAKDGRQVPVRLSVAALQAGDGAVLGWIGTAVDLTVRRQFENEANRFFQISLDLLAILDLQGRFRRVNPAWTRFLGWQPEEVVGRSYLEFLHPDDQIPSSAEVTRLNLGVPTLDFSNRYRHKDGSWRTIQWHCSPDLANGLLFAGGMDITDHLAVVEELRTARREAQAKAEQLNLALTSSGTGMWDWYVDSGKLHLSPTWFTMRGFAIDERPHTYDTWADLLHPEDKDRVMAALQAHLEQEIPYQLTYRSQRKDGSWQWLQERGEVVSRDLSGKPLRMVGTNVDVSELKTLMQGLDEARIAAEAAAQAKSDFLATMSHEIRTPMNGVLGLTSVLLGEPMIPAHRQIVETIRRSGETLQAVLNDILDLAKIESGRLALHLEPVAADQVVQDAVLLFRGQAEAKGLTLELAPMEVRNALWEADPIRIRQVVLNLVSNALKFTERGSVRLRLEVRADRLRLEVQDTGVGIPADRLGQLFQRFSQIDSQTTRRQGGTGLGLAISKHLVELMHGEITVVSAPGAGSTFTIDLPRAEGSSSHHHKIRPEQPSAPRSLRLLVAEDNKVNQMVARKMLEQLGHTMVLAENGRQAVARWAEGGHDAILMDWQMPELDGLDATRQIRQREAQEGRPRIPIFAMTANVLDGDRETCLTAGMDDVVAKPVIRERLVAVLAQVQTRG